MKVPTVSFVLFYLVCSPALTLGFKFLFSNLDFRFPLSTVNLLLLFEWFIAAIVRPFVVSEDERDRISQSEGGSLFQKYSAIIVGLCLAAELAFSNMSLLTLSVSFHTMVKSATPAYVLFFSTLFGLEKPNIRLVVVVFIIIFGIILCSFGEIQFAWSGFIFVCLSSASSGLRWSVSHLYLSYRETSSPIELLFKSLPSAFLVLPIFCFIVEMHTLKAKLISMTIFELFELLILVVTFAIFGFGMVFVELSLVKRISSLSFSILAIFKELLVVALSMVLNHDKVDLLTSLGFIFTLFGVFCFKHLRQEHHILQDEFANPHSNDETEALKLTSLFSKNSSSSSSSGLKNNSPMKLNVVVQNPGSSNNSGSGGGVGGYVDIRGMSHGVNNPLLQDNDDDEPL